MSVVCLFFLSGWIRQIAGAIVKSVHSMESMIKTRCKAIVENAVEITRRFAFLASVSMYLLAMTVSRFRHTIARLLMFQSSLYLS